MTGFSLYSVCYHYPLMPDKKPVTRQDLIAALQGHAERQQRERKEEHRETTENLKTFFYDTLAGFELDQINPKLDKINERLDKLEIAFRSLKDKYDGLIAEFAATPSKRDFKELRTRVDKMQSDLDQIKEQMDLAA